MTGLEMFGGPLAKVILDLAKSVGGNLFESLSNDRKAAAALKTYIDKYQSRHCSIKLLGMSQGKQLELMYTPVRFLDKLSIRNFKPLEDLENEYNQKNDRGFQTGRRSNKDDILIANENQYLMILGGPGAGKSTFLRRVGLEALKGDRGLYEHRCIPIFLELKRFTNSQTDLIKSISEELKHFGFPPSIEFTTKALEQGKLLLLLDGLDEVPNEQINDVINSIHDFIAQYSQNRFIASCRIAAYKSSFQNFKDLQLSDFDGSQIQRFIEKWFQSEYDLEQGTAQKCWKILNEPSNASAKELAQTPLLLTFLCLVYDNSQSFPSQRSRLYDEALDILLKKWSAEKRLDQGVIHPRLNPDLEKILLSEISYQTFIKNNLFFERQQLVNHINDFLSDTVDKPWYLNGDNVLEAIAVKQGILVEQSQDIFSFSHLTFQEYLTALYISQHYREIQKLVTEHLIDKRWREVFLLIAGLMPKADEFLDLIRKESQKFINTKNLANLLIWADSITLSQGRLISSAGKRAVALASVYAFAKADTLANNRVNAFSYSYVDINNAKDIYTNPDLLALTFAEACAFNSSEEGTLLANVHALIDAYSNAYADTYADSIVTAINKFLDHARICQQLAIYSTDKLDNLIYKLEQLKIDIPERNRQLEDRKNFAKKILQIYVDALDLKSLLIVLSTEELECLDRYCYANLLLLKCKKASIRVSLQVWEEIERKMLLPV